MFSQIDFFGKPVELNFNGKTKSRSSAGAWFSLILFVFICLSTYQLGKDLINRKEPKTRISESFLEDPEPMLISPDTFNFGIGLQNPTTLAHYRNESIYAVEVTKNQLKRILSEDGTTDMTWTRRIPLLTEPCKKEHFGALASNFENIELNSLYCLKNNQPGLEEIRIQGVIESSIFEEISVTIKQCNNQTSKVECASKETIEELLGKGSFAIYYTNLAIEAGNYSHPNLRYRDSYYTSMSKNYLKELRLMLSHVEIATDSGWITEHVKKHRYIKRDYLQELTTFESDLTEMVKLNIRVGKIVKNYDRSYIKVQDILASLNGLVTVGVLVGLIFFMPYSNIKFYERLTNELFDVKTLSDNQKQRRNSRKRTKKGRSTINYS